jgi:hypothetical protein
MDDPMIDLIAGYDELGRRLGAYGLERLSPELAASTRMRARVLAVAHRQATLARADASLALLQAPDAGTLVPITGSERPGVIGPAARRGHPWRRLAAASFAAMLALAAVGGTVFAARAGGPLYETRLWIEMVNLPADPSERAVAELDRLSARLQEATEATAAGDGNGAAAALAAYGAIVDEASSHAIVAGDSVASAAIQAGIARNVAVLQALAGRLPPTAAAAVTRALDRALEHSSNAMNDLDHAGTNSGGTGGSGGSGSGNDAGEPGSNPGGGGEPPDGAGEPGDPPAATDKPDPTKKPEPPAPKTPKPDPEKTPPGGNNHPTDPPAGPDPERTPRGGPSN